MPGKFGFGKAERLKSRKQIEFLFTGGQRFSYAPLRVIYHLQEAGEDKTELKAGVSASKKFFKKAVDRNRLKRLMREAYRLQKALLKEGVMKGHKKLFVFFIYADKEVASFASIEAAMAKCLKRLTKIVNESAD